MDNVSQSLPVEHKHRILRRTTQRIQKTLRTRRKQKGFDLIQLGLVVALIGLMMGAALVGVPRLIENIKTGQQVEDLRGFATQAQTMFANYRHTEITPEALAGAQLYPSEVDGSFAADKPAYLSRYLSEPVTLAVPAGNTPSERYVEVSLVPPSAGACSKIAAQMAPLAASIKTNDTETRADGTPPRVNAGLVATNCQLAFGPAVSGEEAPSKTKSNLTIKIRV